MTSTQGPVYVYDDVALAWKAPGRPDKPATHIPVLPWQNPKDSGGLVCVKPNNIATVASYGVNHGVMKADTLPVGIPWSALHTAYDTYDFSRVDNLLSAYPTANLALRIQSGDSAPDWLKTLTGTVEVWLTSRSANSYVPHWWEETGMAAWQRMITKAGERYDNHPRVHMVSADAPMVEYSEPFILGNDDASAIRLYNANCNLTTHKAAIKRCVDDTIAAFPNTLVELAIHDDMQYPTATGMGHSWPEGRQLALDLCTTYGPHLIISEYGLGVGDTGAARITGTGNLSTKTNQYDWMHYRTTPAAGDAAGPVFYQLTPQGSTNYAQMAQNAIDLGGSMCETAGWGSLGSSAASYDAALRANAAIWSA